MAAIKTFVFIISVYVIKFADANLDLFKQYQEQLFTSDGVYMDKASVSNAIDSMVSMIEAGEVPAEAQGEQTLEFLRTIRNDTKLGAPCNMDEDLAKLERIRGIVSLNPSLERYLQFRENDILLSCADVVHKRAAKKLVTIDENSLRLVGILSDEVHDVTRRKLFEKRQVAVPYYVVVLRSLKEWDPEGAKRVMKKWVSKEKALDKFMSKIHESCVSFLEQLDPIVATYPDNWPMYSPNRFYREIMKWNYSKNSCKGVIDNWDSIMETAHTEYEKYLREPKPIKYYSNSGPTDEQWKMATLALCFLG